MSTMTTIAMEPCLSGSHYRRANASGGRITTQNDCRILQSFPRMRERSKRRGYDGCDDSGTVRTRGRVDAHKPQGTGEAGRAGYQLRWGNRAAPMAGWVPLLP